MVSQSASFLSPVLRGEGPWGYGLPPWMRRRCFGYFRKIPHHCEYVFKLTVNGSYSVCLFEPVLRGEGPLVTAFLHGCASLVPALFWLFQEDTRPLRGCVETQ